jgi:hypothetical protein
MLTALEAAETVQNLPHGVANRLTSNTPYKRCNTLKLRCGDDERINEHCVNGGSSMELVYEVLQIEIQSMFSLLSFFFLFILFGRKCEE